MSFSHSLDDKIMQIIFVNTIRIYKNKNLLLCFLYIIQLSDINIFNDFQFGFVPSRSTTTAISLLHDVGAYCVNNDSQMYTCSLDAEGAFDAVSFPVLFAIL